MTVEGWCGKVRGGFIKNSPDLTKLKPTIILVHFNSFINNKNTHKIFDFLTFYNFLAKFT